MRIGIDVSPAVHQQAGVGRYTQELVKHLLKIDNENEYVLFYYYSGKDPRPFAEFPNVRLRPKCIPGRAIRLGFFALHKLHLNANFLIGDVDIFHSPDCVLPPLSFKSILTIHDLTFLLYPQYYTWLNRTHLNTMTPLSAKKALKITADSKNTKRDAINLLKVPSSKVETVYPGIDERFKPAKDKKLRAFKLKYQLPDKYILFVGTLEPRKNVITLIDAFYKLKESESFKYKLVITGRKGWLYKNIFREIHKLNMSNKVKFTDFIPDEELPTLYSGGDLFVYPSLYEGFGLPPLEAMACGTPVITSDTSSLPEVIGDAGILINPEDTQELANRMRKVLTDSELRKELSRKGLERAKQFSWEKTARQTLDLYREVAEEKI
ncbi:MAG: glycosyltransferase family 1 protein [Actinomycetota bacterium]|nr:glycosyltransferase family 1 protein [Actinomycetota bacterium]